MAVSGTMAITNATLVAGSGSIAAQRGNATWGANYVFNKEEYAIIGERRKNMYQLGDEVYVKVKNADLVTHGYLQLSGSYPF